MENSQIEEVRTSRVLQGCLFGSVFLFVALLAAMLVLAYLRFQEATDPEAPDPAPVPPVSAVDSPPASLAGEPWMAG